MGISPLLYSLFFLYRKIKLIEIGFTKSTLGDFEITGLFQLFQICPDRSLPCPSFPWPTSIDQERSEYTQKSGFDPASGDLPTSIEDVYVLLNIDADTPLEEANKVYWAVAKVWQVDGATGEEDRKRRYIKTTQLNVAKEFLTGKRS